LFAFPSSLKYADGTEVDASSAPAEGSYPDVSHGVNGSIGRHGKGAKQSIHEMMDKVQGGYVCRTKSKSSAVVQEFCFNKDINAKNKKDR
jgi:hypothetical protein